MMCNRIKAMIAAGVLACSMTACGTGGTQAADMTAQLSPQTVAGKTADDEFQLSQMQFALQLLEQTLKTCPEDNVLISPYSAMQALAMTANGASGDTLAEMEQVLGGIPIEQLNEYLYSYRTSLPETEFCKFQSANSMWIQDQENRIQMQPDFLQTAKDYYCAEAYLAPFNGSTVRDINNWGKEHTDGAISRILDKIPDDAVLYLVNTVMFDGQWEDKYQPEDINKNVPFYPLTGAEQSCSMMCSDEHLYLSDENACGFMKYYKREDYAFCALKPMNDLSPQEYLETLDAEKLCSILKNPEECEVITGLPEYTCEYDASLVQPLKAMGMEKAFTEQADLSRTTQLTDNPLCISEVLQKTQIEVNAEGTKARVITLNEAEDSSAPSEDAKEVYLNRPFIYMIIDTQAKLPLFIGTVQSVDAPD